MWPRRNHKPAAQSRARVFERPDQRQTGSDYSPLLDAFHPSFPASVDQYISQPWEANREDSPRNCLDRSPCHAIHFGHNAHRQGDSALADRHSAEFDCVSDAHRCYAEGRGDDLLVGTSAIFRLPSEVSDLILSHLSPAALDAARHTCKEWRTRILSSPWVLSSVLGTREERDPVTASLRGGTSHRNLLKKFDCVSDLASTFQHPDGWRTRFRTRNLDFSIPSPSSTRTGPALVAAARIGTQNGLLAFQLQASPQGTRHRPQSTLAIYCFDSADLPWYAGAVHQVEGEGALRITGVSEVRRRTEWVLKIEIGDTVGLYVLTAREAFSDTESRFSLKILESLEETPHLSSETSVTQKLDRPPDALLISDQFWNLIAPLPPNGLPRDCFSAGLRRHAEPRFLAEQTATGDMYLVMEVGPFQKPPRHGGFSLSQSFSNDTESDNRRFIEIALLSRPRPKSVYRNIAVAPTTTKTRTVQAVIVWQTADLEKPISELYVYDIPEAMYHEPRRGYGQTNSDDISTTAENLNGGAILQPCHLVQGKRVTSLDKHMGGIHPSSSLHQHACAQEIALGGLQLPQTSENQEAHPQNVQYQKCFVWGPAPSEGNYCTRLTMKIFDFSFADPQRLRSLVTYGVAVGWRHDKRFHNVALDSLHCACALHDDGFRVVLPTAVADNAEASEPACSNAVETAASSLETKSALLRDQLSSLNNSNGGPATWSFWPPKPTSSDRARNEVGVLSSDDSPARRAALERRQEWLRGRIAGMKAAGLTDFEIAELWNVSAWTLYGLVRKPEGWRELRMCN